jgi:ubiquinone/menaquinone biosynthesis C-methylase UbiE
MQNMPQHPICNYEGSPYQSIFWDQANRKYEDLAEAHALRELLPKSGRFLLELGAGAGRNTARYSGFNRIALLDYSISQLEQARLRLGDSEKYMYIAANIYSLPFSSGIFDAATMIRTLHHMAEPEAALREIRRVLDSGAFFLLEYANKQNIKSILRFLLRRQNWNPFSHDSIEFAPLNFDFHPTAIRLWLSHADFKIQRQITVSNFRAAWLKRIAPAAILARVDSLFGRTGNLFQLSPSVFVAARAMGVISASNDASAVFRCPRCFISNLKELSSNRMTYLECAGCGSRWGIQGGIYDFREPLTE